jgi:hypothetical protein
MIDCVKGHKIRFLIWSRLDLTAERYFELILIRWSYNNYALLVQCSNEIQEVGVALVYDLFYSFKNLGLEKCKAMILLSFGIF